MLNFAIPKSQTLYYKFYMANIIDVLKQGETIDSHTRIKLPIEGNAEIYGFVPYYDDAFSNLGMESTPLCPPLGPANVVGNRVIFGIDGKIYRSPLFKTISTPEEKYPIYLLYVPRLMNLSAESKVKTYIASFKNEKPSYYINSLEGIKMIDNKPFYYPKEDDYLFTSPSSLRAVGNAFVVITRRRSKDNGLLLYEVYPPEDVDIKGYNE